MKLSAAKLAVTELRSCGTWSGPAAPVGTGQPPSALCSTVVRGAIGGPR